ncbi:hypothetical protein Daus18300_007169 [Diaporthe australafricana]|uniref:Amidase domain-containing protein n=1 Tax=Diaporthe australafricana TaxID=127596 RepID=A0ABR3WPD0_9PEZI
MALKHLITCIVAGIDYLVHPQILGSVEESVRADQIIPVVVLSEKEINAGPEELGRTLRYLVDNDDVCTDEFTGIIVVKPSGSGPEPSGGLDNASDAAAQPSPDFPFTLYHLTTGPDTSSERDLLPSGPYFLSGQNLHQAWRLYPDDLDAFTFGLLPDSPFDPESFQAVTSLSSDGISKTIPVPSRLYHKPNAKKPLAGKRISLKDTIDVKGAKTTLSSRAWAQLYPAADASAAYVKKLLDLGAVVVGKTKTTQFATGLEWVDFQSPVNPRGDRYHEASGSSVGAAASLAGYRWLDSAVGVDSDGGVRDPAADHGLHAIRPSSSDFEYLEGIKISSESDYSDAYGREPFVETSPRFRWSVAKEVTNDDYEEYLARLETFRTWFDKTVMSLESGSDDAIMILPSGIADQKYRDEPPHEPEALEGIDTKLLSSVLGTPQIVVPFAQLPYKSRVTEQLEYKPISASLMGARGSDLSLLRLVQEATQAAGWRTNVDTGRRAFPVGKNIRHVRDLGDDDRGGAKPAPLALSPGRPGAGDRCVASGVAENRSAADESGSELVSQVPRVVRAPRDDLWNAGAGASRGLTGPAAVAVAASPADCAEGGRRGCQVRHDEVSTIPDAGRSPRGEDRGLPFAGSSSSSAPTAQIKAPEDESEGGEGCNCEKGSVSSFVGGTA